MLQNAYLLAKIGADTAEIERNFAENLPKIGNYPTGPPGRGGNRGGAGGAWSRAVGSEFWGHRRTGSARFGDARWHGYFGPGVAQR